MRGANEELDIGCWPMAMFFKDGDQIGERSGYNYDPKTIEDLFCSLVPMAREKSPSPKAIPESENAEKSKEDIEFQQGIKPEPVTKPEGAEPEQKDEPDQDPTPEKGVEPEQDQSVSGQYVFAWKPYCPILSATVMAMYVASYVI